MHMQCLLCPVKSARWIRGGGRGFSLGWISPNQGEVEGPVVEVVGVDEGLVDGESVFGEVGVAGVAGFGIEADLVAGGVVGVELLEETLVGPEFAVGSLI